MLAPLSWLKEFVNIKLPLKELMWKMTEAGLTCESFKNTEGDTILDIEVTANRPDWMSIVGVAREIAAIESVKIKEPKISEFTAKNKNYPLNIKTDFDLCPRYSAVLVRGVSQKASPEWMQKRLIRVGLRPINNLVDVSNYVMFELGNPIHIFDYDKLDRGELSIMKSRGGEKFVSVDDKEYVLPKDAIIFKSGNKVVDLCGIKGGANSGVSETTKNVLILVAVYNGSLIRRTSIKLGLWSEASRIFERGANSGGTITTLKRTANLIQELAGGKIESEIKDKKDKDYGPVSLTLTKEKLDSVLGLNIPAATVRQILEKLNLKPEIAKGKFICTIPTYRGDLKIEEDLIEEVARIYGYNNFPKTLPLSETTKDKIPYYFNSKFNLELKNLMVSGGYTETMSLSLVSKELVEDCRLDAQNHIRISNPVSSEYEYLRRTLLPSLLIAAKLNPNDKLKIFELDKVFLGPLSAITEPFRLSAIARGISFREFKGMIDLLIERLNMPVPEIIFEAPLTYWHPSRSAVIRLGKQDIGFFGEIHPSVLEKLSIKETVYALELSIRNLNDNIKPVRFKPVPSYPAQIEDLTLHFPDKTKIGEVLNLIKSTDKLISEAELTGIYQNSYTFRIWYQSAERTLKDSEIENIRSLLIKKLREKFGASVK